MYLCMHHRSGCVCRDACVSVHARSSSMPVYLDMKLLLTASQPPPPSVLLTAEPVCLGERLGKHVGENPEEQEGDPAYLLPASERSQLVRGRLPKYDTLNICFGLVSVFR